MKIHTETKEVVGEVYTQFGTYKLLKLFPNAYDVPSQMRERGFLSLYVIDTDGYAKNIYVNSYNMLIKPFLEIREVPVHFLIEEENIKVDSLE